MKKYPSLLFAKDGEIFDLDGKKTIAIGGAYSIDKAIRIARGWPWFADEQPSFEIKDYVEAKLAKNNWTVDVVLSHTAPLIYEPREVFIPGLDQRKVDKSTEMWLYQIESKLNYRKWYCGHYHTEKKAGQFEIMFENFGQFGIN